MYKKTITKLSAIMAIMTLFSTINVQAAVMKPTIKTTAKITAKTTTKPVARITAKPVVKPVVKLFVAPIVIATPKPATPSIIISTVASQTTVTPNDNLQSALTSGKSLLLGDGNYSIGSINNISNNIKIEGGTSTVINGNNNGSFSLSGLHDVEFKNIVFTNLVEMNFKNSTNLKFTNCKFLNFIENGIVLDTFKNVEFSNCIISKIGSTAINPTWQGMGMYLVKGTNLQIHDSEISNTYGHATLFLVDNTNFEIRNNKLHDTFYRAIELYENGNSGTIISNNIYNCGSINTTNSGIGCNGIFANGNSGNVDIISNTISNVLENAIEGQFRSILTNVITGTGIDMKNHPTPSGEGIYLTTGKCNGNTIKNTNGPAIKGYSDETISNIEISKNIMINCIGSTYAVGFNSQVGYTNLTITNNTSYSTQDCVALRDMVKVNVVVSGNVTK